MIGESGLSRCSQAKKCSKQIAYFLHPRRVARFAVFGLAAFFFGERFAVAFFAAVPFLAAAFFFGERFTDFFGAAFFVAAFFFGDRLAAFFLGVAFAVFFFGERFAVFFFGERFAVFLTAFLAAFFLVAIYHGSSITSALSIFLVAPPSPGTRRGQAMVPRSLEQAGRARQQLAHSIDQRPSITIQVVHHGAIPSSATHLNRDVCTI